MASADKLYANISIICQRIWRWLRKKSDNFFRVRERISEGNVAGGVPISNKSSEDTLAYCPNLFRKVPGKVTFFFFVVASLSSKAKFTLRKAEDCPPTSTNHSQMPYLPYFGSPFTVIFKVNRNFSPGIALSGIYPSKTKNRHNLANSTTLFLLHVGEVGERLLVTSRLSHRALIQSYIIQSNSI